MSIQDATSPVRMTPVSSSGLLNLAYPEVRYYARKALRAGKPAALVADAIGVTVAELEAALRPIRGRAGR